MPSGPQVRCIGIVLRAATDRPDGLNMERQEAATEQWQTGWNVAASRQA